MSRSQARLRVRRGYDIRGNTAYQHGDRTDMAEATQYRASVAAGFSPPLPAGKALPVNTVAPAITGTPTVGQQLAASTGTWTGTATITYSYQWLRGAGSTPIAGANAALYTAALADVGQVLRCRITASNAFAEVTATSNPTSAVAAA